MRVDHQNVGRVHEDGRVAIDYRIGPRGRKIDIVGHLLNIEKIRAGSGSERLRPSRAMRRDLQDGRSYEHIPRKSREEIPP